MLDIGQLFAQGHGELAGRGRRIADDETAPLERGDRRDHCGRSAGEHLGDFAAHDALAQLVKRYLALLDRMAAITRQLQNACAGDAFKDAARKLGRDHRAVTMHHADVHAAELLEILAVLRIEKEHL